MNHRTPWLALGLLLCVLAVQRSGLMKTHIYSPETTIISTDDWSAELKKVQSGISDTIQIEKYRVTNQHLLDLAELPVRQLHLDHGRITDEGVQHLVQLKSLTAIRLRDSPLTDVGLQSLSDCSGLDDINLPQANCTDAGLRELIRLPKLRYLRFSSPLVTEAGLSELANIKTLRWLHLIRVPVTNAVLQKLATLPNLESLYVDDAPADDAAWEAFFAARPTVHVHVNQTHHDRDPSRH